MFSSNQILEVSGSLSNEHELENALEFALKCSGNYKNMEQAEINRGCKLLYQITEEGKYCIGWGFENVPNGWHEYPFIFDVDIVSKIIRQYLEKSPLLIGNGDGSYEKGFVMKCIETSMSSEKNRIKNPFYGIVYFMPYTCFYHK